MDKRNTRILPSGEGHNELTKQYPKLSGFLQSAFTGEAPDEIGSVMDPLTADRQAGAKAGYPLSIAAQTAPIVGALAKWASSGSLAHRLADTVGNVGKSYVVKPKGGNWITGRVEDTLDRLQTLPHWNHGDQVKEAAGFDIFKKIREDHPGVDGVHQLNKILVKEYPEVAKKLMPAGGNERNNFVNKQLTRYVKNEMGTPEDPIRALVDAWPVQLNDQLAKKQLVIDRLEAKKATADPRVLQFLNRDIEATQAEMQNLKNYNPLHYAPDNSGRGSVAVRENRREAGFPEKGMATTDIGKKWEAASDAEIAPGTADDYLADYRQQGSEVSPFVKQDPWLEKVDPATPVFTTVQRGSGSPVGAQNLGFNHLMDELRNATNPTSGLPANLLLKPESLDRVSMPQAVEHVAKINQWRQEQKIAADAAKANNAATVLHKDYPEHGFKWVELKKSDQLPEGWTSRTKPGSSQEEWITPEGKLQEVNRDPRSAALEDALKYEGDTMGHCVGGYCPDVTSGRSRIFSLRDAKTGQPHITIETQPSRIQDFTAKTPDPDNPARTLRDRINAERAGNGDFEDYGQKVLDSLGIKVPESIVQIKGKGNAAPIDKYKPFAQDFVKSGQWSDVGDLQNTGLVKIKGGTTNIYDGPNKYPNISMPEPGYYHPREIADHFESQGVPTLAAKQHAGDVEGLTQLLAPDQNFAKGGHVQPSEAQIAAGNYPKGHVWAHGLNISIENPADSIRSGKNAKGDEWHTRMQHDYGYIRGTKGADKDHVDVFLGPDFKDRQVPVHVIDQHKEDGTFDEHKIMMGFKTPEDAKSAYLGNYHDGWDGGKNITPMHVDDFKTWVKDKANTSKPAVESGKNYASGGRVETQTDRDVYQRKQMEHSNQVLKQMARGWAAGTAGLPHDIDNLVRMFVRPHTDPTSVIGGWARRDSPAPSTDFYNEWLPGASDDPRLQAAAETANLAGGVGLGLPAKLAARSGAAVLGHAGKMLDAGVHGEGALAKVLAPAAPMYAVKPKGGNWTQMPGHDPEMALDFHDIAAHNTTAPNKWRGKQLVNYIKNQMGTADDPLLKLEQEGRLHMTPQQMVELAPEYGIKPIPMRDSTQFGMATGSMKPEDVFHRAATGRSQRTPWENLSDAAIGRHSPGEEVNNILEEYDAPTEANTIGSAVEQMRALGDISAREAEMLARHSWLDKVDPKTPIYGVGDPQGLGFQHMMDYMDQANAAGQALEHHGSLEKMRERALGAMPNAPIHDFIPLIERNLHLSDADIARSSVSDIAAKTGEWNKILEQTKTLRAQAQVPTHKTYDTGHTWKAVPDTATNDDALNFCLGAGKDAGWCTQASGLAQHYGGNGNQLYILHDPTGKPKVQIAVEPGDPHPDLQGDSDGLKAYLNEYPDDAKLPYQDQVKGWADWSGMSADDVLSTHPEAPKAAIREIKGRMNRKPDPEDLPMVQDFVKSGNWSRVGDLQNTGLRKTSDMFNDLERQKIKEAGGEMGEYHTPEELGKFGELGFPPGENYADGGRVNFEDGGSSDSGSSDSGGSDSGPSDSTRATKDSDASPTAASDSGSFNAGPSGNAKPGESQMAQAQSQISTAPADTIANSLPAPTLAERWGIIPGMTKDQFFAQETPAQRDDRMGLVSKAIGSVGNLALNAALGSIPGANFIRTGINAVGAYNNGMSGSDVAKNAAMDLGTGYLTADINKAIPGLIGTDATNALNKYNTLGSLVNTLSPGTMPGVNAGALASSFLKDQTGVRGLGNYVGVPGSSGQTLPDGSKIPDVQPWHGGNSQGSGPLTTTVAPPSAGNNPSVWSGAYDPMALGNHALRVYDPVFNEGVTA